MSGAATRTTVSSAMPYCTAVSRPGRGVGKASAIAAVRAPPGSGDIESLFPARHEGVVVPQCVRVVADIANILFADRFGNRRIGVADPIAGFNTGTRRRQPAASERALAL